MAAKKKNKKKQRNPKLPPKLAKGARGKSVVDALVAHLTGPNAPSGERRPLSDAELRACEQAAGAALSPALFAVLSIDAGELARDHGWFDKKMRLLARPFGE